MAIVSEIHSPQHEQIVHRVWSTFTRPKDGFPVSRKACAILLSLVTVQPPRVILLMKLDEIDFDRSVWRAPESKTRRSYPVPLTRLAKALIGQAHSFRKEHDGDYLFPGCFDPKIPMAKAVIRRTFLHTKLAPTALIKRPAYDLPVAAAWVMADAGVDADNIRAVMHQVSQHELLRVSKLTASEGWILNSSRAALERFEASLMRIVGLNYSDPLFRRPQDFYRTRSPFDLAGSKQSQLASKIWASV